MSIAIVILLSYGHIIQFTILHYLFIVTYNVYYRTADIVNVESRYSCFYGF